MFRYTPLLIHLMSNSLANSWSCLTYTVLHFPTTWPINNFSHYSPNKIINSTSNVTFWFDLSSHLDLQVGQALVYSVCPMEHSVIYWGSEHDIRPCLCAAWQTHDLENDKFCNAAFYMVSTDISYLSRNAARKTPLASCHAAWIWPYISSLAQNHKSLPLSYKTQDGMAPLYLSSLLLDNKHKRPLRANMSSRLTKSVALHTPPLIS